MSDNERLKEIQEDIVYYTKLVKELREERDQLLKEKHEVKP